MERLVTTAQKDFDENLKAKIIRDISGRPLIISKFAYYDRYEIGLGSEKKEFTSMNLENGKTEECTRWLQYAAIMAISYKNVSEYAPENTDLYKDAINVNTDDIPEILSFCQKYGIPDGPPEQGGRKPIIRSVKLDYLKNTFKQLKEAVTCWQDISDYDSLNNYIKDCSLDKFVAKLSKYDLPSNWRQNNELPLNINQESLDKLEHDYKSGDNFIALNNVRNDSNETKARQYLALLITKHLPLIACNQGMTFDKGRFRPYITFQAPIDYVWYQLREHVMSGVTYMNCWKCGNLFTPTKPSQHFCPPILQEKRSSCENAYSQKFHYYKQKILELDNQNISHDSISTQTGIKKEYIDHRLKKMQKKEHD